MSGAGDGEPGGSVRVGRCRRVRRHCHPLGWVTCRWGLTGVGPRDGGPCDAEHPRGDVRVGGDEGEPLPAGLVVPLVHVVRDLEDHWTTTPHRLQALSGSLDSPQLVHAFSLTSSSRWRSCRRRSGSRPTVRWWRPSSSGAGSRWGRSPSRTALAVLGGARDRLVGRAVPAPAARLVGGGVLGVVPAGVLLAQLVERDRATECHAWRSFSVERGAGPAGCLGG
ncbi:hypothetical protein DC74_p00024 (plasmid) [Streptomyces noursei]|nr:hypothetical protein DC74_p00024 [Streptomyces noursei]